MDGLVSTGNKFPCTILEINFFNQKNFPNYFINILKLSVDKPNVQTMISINANMQSMQLYIPDCDERFKK